MRVLFRSRRLVQVEHRGEADVGPAHDLAPLRLGLAGDSRGELLAKLRPGGAVHLASAVRTLEPGLLQQQGVELRLERPDGNPFDVRAPAGVEEVRAKSERARGGKGG